MAEEVKESTKEKSSVGRMLQIGGAVVGTLVGSGFASGQEVMQYFTAYGIPGVWGAVLTMVLFALMCAAVTYYGWKFAKSEHFSAFRTRRFAAQQGFFFCGIIDEPVAKLSESVTKPNSVVDHRMISSHRRDKCIIETLQAYSRSSR